MMSAKGDLTVAASLQGAFWGMFFGLAVGAAFGALGGKMADYGIDDDFIKGVRD